MQGQSREAEEAISACLDELAQRRGELPPLLLELRRGDHAQPAQTMLRRQQRRLVQHGAHLWGRGPGAVVSTCMLIAGMAFFLTTTVGAHVLDFS